MKDPLDKQERPYEVLDVDPSASVQSVQKAYTRFVADRTRIARRSAAAVARDRLSRVERRLEDEMFYYSSPSAAMSDGGGERAIHPFAHEPEPPSVSIDASALAAAWPVSESDYDPFCQRLVQFANISIFEERLLSCLPMEFPT